MNLLLLKWFLGIYVLIAAFLGFWGVIQGTGLPGWLVALEVEKLGTASLKLTAVLSILIYCLPLLAVVALLKRFAPTELEDLNKSLKGQQPELQTSQSAPPDFRPIKTWAGILKLALILIAITLLSTAIVYYQIRRSESTEILRTAVTSLPPANNLTSWERIELTGAVPKTFYAAFREGSFHHVYLPVTHGDWTKADPVRAFVHYKAYAEQGQRISLPAELENASGELVVKGTRGSSLPVFAERMMRGQGARIEPDPLIVDWDPREPKHEVFPEQALMPLVIGLFITIIAVVTMAVVKKTGVGKKIRSTPI